VNLLSAKSEIYACMDRTAPAPANGLLMCAGPVLWKEAARVIISPDTIRRANIFIGRLIADKLILYVQLIALSSPAAVECNALRSALARCDANT